jgi:FtsZ-binding cell division protein ZapB
VIEVPEEGLHSSRSLALSPTPSHLGIASPTFQIPESTLEELQLLHTRISELSSEQTALQDEIIRLENEMEEVQRVNSDLQEQNENYEVLVSERMLAGLGAFTESRLGSGTTAASLQGDSSRPTSSLDRLDEEDGLSSDDDDGAIVFESSGDGNLSTGAVAANMTPERIKRTAKQRQSIPGSGGGLDLEAELDRARQEEEDRKKAEEKAKRKKDRDSAARRRANQSTATVGDSEPIPADVETLRQEVKLLRQENKGVSRFCLRLSK